MSYCEIDAHYNFKELHDKKVIDKANNNVGFIHDLVFDSKMNLIAFVLKGSPLNELVKKIESKKDVELVIPIDDVESIGEYIVLSKEKSELKNYLDKNVIPKGSYFYNNLKNMEILDAEDKKIGTIGGLVLLPCREISFLVRGSVLDKIATSLGLLDEWDLLLPVDHITTITEKKMKIDLTKDSLENAFKQRHLDVHDAKKYLDSRKVEKQTDIHMLARRYG
ncbi:MAG: hypothetical protein ACFFDW_17610 [Candidatus Thorarchaeota archaeon]